MKATVIASRQDPRQPQQRQTAQEAIAANIKALIHLYHGNASLLAESLEVIQRTSADILSALETSAAESTDETDYEMAQAS